MLGDTYKIGGERHPGKLGTRICYAFSKQYGKKRITFTTAPASTSTRIRRACTGLHEVLRTSHIHTLNQKEAARRYARAGGENL
jgi:butyrate kinase